ncbi:MAG: Coenzyme F420 hydrogenase/dehydrogenase, beta subunit C-terminal domain [Opitutaceae bacterium]
MPRIHNIRQIVASRLCLGCGACAYICPERRISLLDFVGEGIRPWMDADRCSDCDACLQVCPAFENDHSDLNSRSGVMLELKESCGPVLEIWEGHAVDPEIRSAGASGGVITALSLFCIERQGMYGVLQVGQISHDATANRTKLSRSRPELLANTGSRYAPASVCDGLGLVETAPTPCVVVGQPSEVTALRKAERLRSALREKVGLALSFFCAGSPARKGTLELLRRMGIAPDEVADLRYRGNGWPGTFRPALADGRPTGSMTYESSWAFLQAYRPFSTQLFPDGLGDDADIACGDPWYRKISPDEPGQSLVVVRTEKGRKLLRGAIAEGYVSLAPAEPWKLLASQKHLVAKRGAVGGRIAALRLLGLPAPRVRGFYLWKNWLRLGWKERLRSTLGTMRRVFARSYFRQLILDPASSRPVPQPVDDHRRLQSQSPVP